MQEIKNNIIKQAVKIKDKKEMLHDYCMRFLGECEFFEKEVYINEKGNLGLNVIINYMIKNSEKSVVNLNVNINLGKLKVLSFKLNKGNNIDLLDNKKIKFLVDLEKKLMLIFNNSEVSSLLNELKNEKQLLLEMEKKLLELKKINALTSLKVNLFSIIEDLNKNDVDMLFNKGSGFVTVGLMGEDNVVILESNIVLDGDKYYIKGEAIKKQRITKEDCLKQLSQTIKIKNKVIRSIKELSMLYGNNVLLSRANSGYLALSIEEFESVFKLKAKILKF